MSFFRELTRALFLLCLLLAMAPAAGAEELASFLKKIEGTAAAVRNLSCAFTQEKHLALFARPVTFHGRLDLARPDRLRWEFTKPVPSVLILKGDSGLRCDRQQSIRFDLRNDPIMRMVAQQLWMWLGGDYAKLAEEYHLRLGEDNHTLLVEPKDPKIAGFITSVTIAFDPDSNQPRQVEIAEPGGDLTRITFNDYQFDQIPDEALFSRCDGRE